MLKNITLSAEARLIERAREKARREKSTLNAHFRLWLKEYVEDYNRSEDYKNLMKELEYANAGKKFSREEMNER